MVCQRTNSTVQVTVCIREIVVVVDISEVEHIFGLTTIGNRYIVCVTSEVQTMQEKINHSLDFRILDWANNLPTIIATCALANRRRGFH